MPPPDLTAALCSQDGRSTRAPPTFRRRLRTTLSSNINFDVLYITLPLLDTLGLLLTLLTGLSSSELDDGCLAILTRTRIRFVSSDELDDLVVVPFLGGSGLRFTPSSLPSSDDDVPTKATRRMNACAVREWFMPFGTNIRFGLNVPREDRIGGNRDDCGIVTIER
jgi:hypothetical protein